MYYVFKIMWIEFLPYKEFYNFVIIKKVYKFILENISYYHEK